MPDQFTVGKDGLKDLHKFYKQAPRAFQRVSAGVLNSLAFDDRKASMRELGRATIIRSPGLLKTGNRVQTARKTQFIDQQKAISGSVPKPRHDAWEHIQDGSTTRATKFSDAGRGGSVQGKALPSAKLGRAKTHESDYRTKGSGDSRTINFMQQIQQDKTRARQSFLLPRRFRNMPPGIYKFQGGKRGKFRGKRTLVGARLRLLSIPSQFAESSRFTPKKIDWKGKATRRTAAESNVRGYWVRNMDHELRKIKP